MTRSREVWWGSAALLASAAIWGVLWYPYRLLADASVSGELSTLITYLVALLLALAAAARRPAEALAGSLLGSRLLPAIAICAGVTNLGYVLATLEVPVMTVLLLFYLAPVWTTLFARWLLDERLSAQGAMIVGAAFCGAAIMLYRPALLSRGVASAEILALCAGVSFALSNVLLRKARMLPLTGRSIAIFAGVSALAFLDCLWRGVLPAAWPAWSAWIWWLLLGLGVLLYAANLILQYGLARVSANHAIVLLLFELVVGAIAAYLLAGENLRWQDWLGGSLIIAASLLAGRARTAMSLGAEPNT
jgi:drug/metabolite transporter (DMT)-like permease